MSGRRGDILDVTTPLGAVPPCLSIDTQLSRPITNATGVGAILVRKAKTAPRIWVARGRLCPDGGALWGRPSPIGTAHPHFKRTSADKAATKAMPVNRVGDFGLAPGFRIGSHTWSPDAMEGPTPVSALIHAATMVTAGVFMIARCSPLFEYPPTALIVITSAGATTSFLAATTGILQNDLKRVIAYSTCSQLGYMIFACGISNYSVSVFHLMNHAFFKALLFLSAGSVIHAMSDEQDMRKMGGLASSFPFTYAMMLMGSLSLIGFPFLTGFYSKDVILELAYTKYTISGIGDRMRAKFPPMAEMFSRLPPPLWGSGPLTSEQKREEERGPGEPS
ncbi:NADH dehydrogenase subunit 5 [Lathyrus oleraceus]|uniref:NADH dehydrogenase subunit 5 n=1 Tax=Pisum sativum TaxID=3888 RepID=A0A9D5AIY9_PEA|nr:NADH dehydrogenase subunit 5 [Pisum sativum]